MSTALSNPNAIVAGPDDAAARDRNRARIYATVGLPASGKSTWARELVDTAPANRQVWRVNKDDLRAMIGAKHNKALERAVLAARDTLVSAALAAGRSVVVDDTNLAPWHLERLAEIAGEHDAELVAVDFTGVPLRECIARDARRTGNAHVGANKIREMARRWLPGPTLAEPDPALPTAIVVDIDGTLALNVTGRSPYDYEASIDDQVNPAVLATITAHQSAGVAVIVMTGRDEGEARTVTDKWLEANSVTYTELLMRPAGDRRRDNTVKAELYATRIAGRYNVLCALDDRDHVIAMWRDMGVAAWQVNDER